MSVPDPWHIEFDFVSPNGAALYEAMRHLLDDDAVGIIGSCHNCADLGCKDPE